MNSILDFEYEIPENTSMTIFGKFHKLRFPFPPYSIPPRDHLLFWGLHTGIQDFRDFRSDFKHFKDFRTDFRDFRKFNDKEKQCIMVLGRISRSGHGFQRFEVVFHGFQIRFEEFQVGFQVLQSKFEG